MSDSSIRKHVFISHHHNDDNEVTKLSKLIANKGYDFRNSSIRAKPANKQRLKNGLIKDEVLKRLLRMKISWASKTIVLIGKDTHARPWVNWEITQANELGKEIIGIYIRGGTESDVPPAFEKYASALIPWNPDKIIDALNGKYEPFQNPDGTEREPQHSKVNIEC